MYNCDMCDYTSVKAYNLQRHFNSVHLEEKDFPCKHCPMEFDFKIDLDEHMLDRHEEEEEEEKLKQAKKKEKEKASELRYNKQACANLTLPSAYFHYANSKKMSTQQNYNA